MAYGSSHARQSDGTYLWEYRACKIVRIGYPILDSSADTRVALNLSIETPSRRASPRSFIFFHIADTIYRHIPIKLHDQVITNAPGTNERSMLLTLSA